MMVKQTKGGPMNAKLVLGVLLLGLLLVAPVSAGDWEVLGERTVGFRSDHDVITVTASEGLFTKLKLRVLRRGVKLHDVTVHYGDGSKHDLQVRSFIPAGGETRVFDLPGVARVIRKVSVVYSSRGRGRGKAVVRLLGKQAGPSSSGSQPGGSLPQPVGDWELLGKRTVNYSVDRDVIRVTVLEGTFKRIKLGVLYNKIELLDLTVHFGDGGTQDVKVRRVIPAGGETRVIDLQGGARVIKKVEMLYRSGRVRGKKAEIKLWGKH